MITKKLIKPISKVGVANVDLDNYYNKSEIDSKITTIDNEIATKQDILTAGNNITISNNVISANIPQVDLTNYYTRSDIDTKISEVDAKIDWEVVPSTSIIRANNATTIPLNGKRWVHLQGRFTQYTTATGSWNNFTPFTLDTQNYNYMVRFPIYDWNTQTLRASIECAVENGNLVLSAYNTSNQSVAYYLWGDVLVK